MTVSAYDYKRRRTALDRRAELREAMQRAQLIANAQPDFPSLQDDADYAAEVFLLNEEKIEYFEALIDAGRPYGKKQRPAGAPDPIAILVRQNQDRISREQERRRRKGLDPAVTLPTSKRMPTERPIPGLITLEQAQAESDARRAREAEKAAAALAKRIEKETQRAARKELRRQKAAERAALHRAKRKAENVSLT